MDDAAVRFRGTEADLDLAFDQGDVDSISGQPPRHGAPDDASSNDDNVLHCPTVSLPGTATRWRKSVSPYPLDPPEECVETDVPRSVISGPVTDPRPPEPDEPASAHDPDDLAAWAERLDVRSQELDRFGRVAAHDLRAPLRSIEAFTRLALEAENPDQVSEHLDRVLRAAARMRRLLDSLVDFAEAGDRALDVSTISMSAVVRAALADLSVDVDASRAVIDAGDLPVVECDPTQLQRVFTNVLSNSIRYTSTHPPHIVIRGYEEEDRVRVTVTDDGDGFSSDLAEEAFQPLRRLTSSGVGQGIGLAICRRIVEQHGGRIWATSEPGRGTTISFTLATADEA